MLSLSKTKEFDLQYKVIVIGETAVGKSSLIRSYAKPEQPFETNMVSTVGIDFVNVDIQVDGITIRLQIWDTAGQERFRTLTTNQFRGAKGILLVYDITSARSFDNLNFWLDSLKKSTYTPISKIVVAAEAAVHTLKPAKDNKLNHEEFQIIGNKSDLIDEREVPKRKGEELAKYHGVKFFETSAKNRMNVKEVFYSLGTQMKDANDPYVYVRQDDCTDGTVRNNREEQESDVIRPSVDNTSQQKQTGYCCSG